MLSRSGRQQQGLGRMNRSSSEGDFLRKGSSNEANQEGLSKMSKTKSYATPKVGLPGNAFGPALQRFDLCWCSLTPLSGCPFAPSQWFQRGGDEDKDN